MKTLQDYITEADAYVSSPAQGDEFDIELAPDQLVESYVIEVAEDHIVIDANDAVISVLEQHGMISEEIRRYGMVGTSPGLGHTLGESTMGDIKKIYLDLVYDLPMGTPESEFLTHWQRIIRNKLGHDVDLDTLSGLRQEYRDKYRRMSHRGETFGWEKEMREQDAGPGDHLDAIENNKATVQTDEGYIDRMLELAGCDRRMEEDQDAQVLAQKEVDDDITEPMPGVHEAEYQGREVKLGKPFLTPGGPKKRSVYVKNPKGNVVKVNFGDPDMKIKKSDPARRKSFRARHRCENPGPRHKARYWSCKAW